MGRFRGISWSEQYFFILVRNRYDWIKQKSQSRVYLLGGSEVEERVSHKYTTSSCCVQIIRECRLLVQGDSVSVVMEPRPWHKNHMHWVRCYSRGRVEAGKGKSCVRSLRRRVSVGRKKKPVKYHTFRFFLDITVLWFKNLHCDQISCWFLIVATGVISTQVFCFLPTERLFRFNSFASSCLITYFWIFLLLTH